ncbi:hypothetical protein B0H14DRAFT_2595141 [Mycena olivaceomarginata]|nr:hypothetical protein B0H14DRAFT_2595141 [Mycena olivaceomarginata]
MYSVKRRAAIGGRHTTYISRPYLHATDALCVQHRCWYTANRTLCFINVAGTPSQNNSDGNRRGRGLEEIIRDGPCASEAKQDQCWWCHTPNVVLFLSHNVDENVLGPPSNSEFHPARSVSDNFHPLSVRTEYLSSTDRSVKNPS